VLDLPDFYFTGDDYIYRFEADAKQRFLELLLELFNMGANYKGRLLKWDTIIEQRAMMLGRYLVGRSRSLDFSEPSPKLVRTDDRELRMRILSLRQSEAEKLRIGKSALHYLRKNAIGSDSFTVHKKTRARIEQKERRGRN
jgi:hypothetical protein